MCDVLNYQKMVKNVRRMDGEMEKFAVKYTNNMRAARNRVRTYTHSPEAQLIDFLHLCMRASRALLSVTHRHHVLHMHSLIDSN